MRFTITLILAIATLLPAAAQPVLWQDVEASSIFLPRNAEQEFQAKQYRTLSLNFEALIATLADAPMEFSDEAAASPVRMRLPLPDGTMALMDVVESPVMAPELAAKYPNIRSFTARSVKNKLISARFDYSPLGFNASISTAEGRVLISPMASNQTQYYASYYTKDMVIDQSAVPPLSCGYDAFDIEEEMDLQQQIALSEQTELSFRNNEAVPLRKYRMALVCTGEYGNAKGGTVEAVMATFNTAVNLINQIFQPEFAARMELIAANESLIHLNPNTDPFVNANNGGALLEQNKNYLNSILPLNAYEIGHIFTMGCTDVGGVASGTACSSNKARGVTCHYTNLNYIVTQVMAHEIGHQFTCGHSWNNCPNSLDQLSSANAFEPGSGSTIMSYQGSCGSQNNIPGPPGQYYNIGSLEDFIFFSRQTLGDQCAETIITDNHQPVIEMPYEDGFWTPISTPFELDAVAEDIDADALTYCWEQYDLGPNTNLGNPILNSPLFRSLPPRPESNRVFPALTKVIQNSFDIYEVLPDYERNLTFRLTVRDNNPDYGGVVWDEVAFKADGSAGPFLVTMPNTSSVNWKVGEYREVSWDVANTDNDRVKCYYVDIRLSLDGGFTYPITLVENTPNDGSAFVTVPDALTNEARVRVQASDNVFFDISNANFFIEEAEEPGYTFDINPVAVPLYCYPDDPINISIQTGSILGYDSTLSLSLLGELPPDASATFEQDVLTAGENTSLNIEFDNFIGRDTFDLQLLATTPGQDSSLRDLKIIVLSNDFSELEMLSPVNGATDILFTTDFSWTDISGADQYDIQIATSPGFEPGTILEDEYFLTGTDYSPEAIFEENDIYFWRIRPINDCGRGEYLAPFAFQTSTVDCALYPPQDLPINLPNNPTTRTSEIFIASNGVISDVNIKGLNINYTPINVLQIKLVSPAGTEAILYDQECLNTGTISLGFDDEAPTDIICPPINGTPMKPIEPLSIFDGEDTFGEWELQVRVVNSGFGGGAINSWDLEFCASVEPAAPSLIRNEVLAVPPGQANTINNSLLEVQDENSAPAGIRYTLLTVPAHGQLFRAGSSEPMTAGDFFTQETINAFNLSYLHDGSDTQEDQFNFIVENEDGGWIPNQVFNIEIDENAPVNTLEASLDARFSIFPNPAQNEVNLQLLQPADERLTVRLYSTQGQELKVYPYPGGQQNLTISTLDMPSGIYFITLEGNADKITRKLVIQR